MNNDDLEILALKGLTGEGLNPADEATQQLQETPYAPLEDVRQEHESWLAELEGLAVEAIATNDWSDFKTHVVNFQNEHELHGEAMLNVGEDASADELQTPSADFKLTIQKESQGQKLS